jgi:hypothetical protein
VYCLDVWCDCIVGSSAAAVLPYHVLAWYVIGGSPTLPRKRLTAPLSSGMPHSLMIA